MTDETKKQEEEAPKTDASAELSEPALDEVVGGTARDAASGLATGKRSHKPVVV